MKKLLCFAFLVCLAFGSVSVLGVKEIVITKTPEYGLENPTLVYEGVGGNSALSEAVGSFVRACGWFDLKKPGSGESDYVLKGSAQGGAMELIVLQGGAPLFKGTFPVAVGQERQTAKKAVDAVLKQVFKQPHKLKGICSSAIVFCAESAPGVRNLYVCDIDGKGVKKLTDYKSLCVEPGWFPDGKSIAYTKYNQTTTDILETRIDSRQTRRLASYPGLNVGASIHPKGQYLALVLSLDNQVELYVKALNSANKLRMTNSKAVEAAPCWSPDGNNVCFVSDEGTKVPHLEIVNVASKKRRKVETFSRDASTPDWSNNNKIVYSCKQNGSYRLAVLDLDQAQSMMSGILDNLPAGDWESPSWAPDNRHVVCMRTQAGRSSLYLVDTFKDPKTNRTRPPRLLFSTDQKLYMPAWSPLTD